MIKYNSTITYKDNTDLQKFIEGTYIPDKVKTLEEFDNIDIKINELNELVENINDGKIKLANNTEYNYNSTIENEIDNINSKLDSLYNDIQGRIDYECYENKKEHKKLKKLVKLAVLSKFI